MTGFAGTAARGALLRLAEPLQVIPISQSRALGRTTAAVGAARAFSGALVPADEWHQYIAPGGIVSTTRPVLVVASDLRDVDGEDLAINTDDIIVRADGQQFKVVERLNADSRFGIVIYTLTEARE